MTTLPQTTSVRLPRPTGNGSAGPGSAGVPMVHGGGGGTAHGAGAAAMSAADVWRVVRANALLISLLLVVSAAVGWAVNWYLLTHNPKYTAVGYLEVQPLIQTDPTVLNPTGVDTSTVTLEQKTQVAALTSEGLLNKVLINEASELRTTGWYQRVSKSGVDIREEFQDAFRAVALPDTRYVRVEFTSNNPKDSQTIVREMCDQRVQDERQNVLERGRDQSKQIAGLKDYYTSQLTELGSRMDAVRSSIDSSGGEFNGRISVKEMELSRFNEALAKAEAELQSIATQNNAVQENLKKGIDPPMIQQMADASPLLNQQRMETHQFKQQYLSMVDAIGENNYRTTNAKGAYERAQADLDNQEAEAKSNARTGYLSNLQSLVGEATKVRDAAKAQADQAAADLGVISGNVAKYYRLEKQREAVATELERINKQLELLNNGQQAKLEGKVSFAIKPELPTTPSFPKLKIILPISMAIGLMLALGIAFIREMTDTTVRSDRDITRIGQIQLLGMVGDESQDPQANGARLPLVIFDAPHSITAEQLRQVRTRLQHAASLDTTRSLLVTSPSPGDGKTTIACNLAAGLALNGRRILLVDGNFRRPEIHKVFGLTNEQGFSTVLNGALTFDEAVQETQVPNLAVMTAGVKPINATEMFESQLLVDFIDRALEEFDHVIFDSGPMMVVSESAAMAPRVDGVVTVVRAQGNSRGLLTRMRDTLRALKAEHLGIVLNGVRAQGGGYYGRNIKTFYEYQNG